MPASKHYHHLYKQFSLLQQIKNGTKRVSFYQLHRLVKQFRRTVAKLLAQAHPVAKACSVFAVSVLLSKEASAQCDTFYNANAANPIVATEGYPEFPHAPYFVDIDGDGDLDYYILDYGDYYSPPVFFRNTGTAKLPVYTYEPGASGFPSGQLPFSFHNTAFVDIDGDGDYDCFVAPGYSFGPVRVKYFENTGTTSQPVFTENEAANPLTASGSYSVNFTFADIDGDGDLDAFVANGFMKTVYANTGTKTSPHFVATTGVRDANSPERVYYDWNRDGLLDYFEFNYGSGTADYYKNTGPAKRPTYVLDNAEGPVFLSSGSPHIITDVNADGAPEVFTNPLGLLNDVIGYATLASVPVIGSSVITIRNKPYTKLTVLPQHPSFTYQWYYNEKRIPGENRPAIIAVKAGSYKATITNSCGTGISVADTAGKAAASSNADAIALAETNPLSREAAQVRVTAYPNPFTQQITLQLPDTYHNAIIKITDLQGRTISTFTAGNRIVHLGSNLGKGVYIVQVIQNRTVVATKKISKQ